MITPNGGKVERAGSGNLIDRGKAWFVPPEVEEIGGEAMLPLEGLAELDRIIEPAPGGNTAGRHGLTGHSYPIP